MTVESSQSALFGKEPETPESLEEARARAARAGLARKTTITDTTTPRVSEAAADQGWGEPKDDLMQDPPANYTEQPAPSSKPDGFGGSDAFEFDRDSDTHWNNPSIPETQEERDRAAAQREGTSIDLIESDAAEARRLEAAGGKLFLAEALRQAALSRRSRR